MQVNMWRLAGEGKCCSVAGLRSSSTSPSALVPVHVVIQLTCIEKYILALVTVIWNIFVVEEKA